MEIGPVVLVRGENDGNKPVLTATPVKRHEFHVPSQSATRNGRVLSLVITLLPKRCVPLQPAVAMF